MKMPHKGRFLHPTQRQLAITVGDRVHHAQHGLGTVKSEWGNWHSCRTCYAPIENNWKVCPHCRAEIHLSHSHLNTGYDIVDVEFDKDGKTYSINKTWLKPHLDRISSRFCLSDFKVTPFITRNPTQEHPDIRVS